MRENGRSKIRAPKDLIIPSESRLNWLLTKAFGRLDIPVKSIKVIFDSKYDDYEVIVEIFWWLFKQRITGKVLRLRDPILICYEVAKIIRDKYYDTLFEVRRDDKIHLEMEYKPVWWETK